MPFERSSSPADCISEGRNKELPSDMRHMRRNLPVWGQRWFAPHAPSRDPEVEAGILDIESGTYTQDSEEYLGDDTSLHSPGGSGPSSSSGVVSPVSTSSSRNYLGRASSSLRQQCRTPEGRINEFSLEGGRARRSSSSLGHSQYEPQGNFSSFGTPDGYSFANHSSSMIRPHVTGPSRGSQSLYNQPTELERFLDPSSDASTPVWPTDSNLYLQSQVAHPLTPAPMHPLPTRPFADSYGYDGTHNTPSGVHTAWDHRTERSNSAPLAQSHSFTPMLDQNFSLHHSGFLSASSTPYFRTGGLPEGMFEYDAFGAHQLINTPHSSIQGSSSTTGSSTHHSNDPQMSVDPLFSILWQGSHPPYPFDFEDNQH